MMKMSQAAVKSLGKEREEGAVLCCAVLCCAVLCCALLLRLASSSSSWLGLA